MRSRLRFIVVPRGSDYNRRLGGGQIVRHTRDWCRRLALLVGLVGAACARPAVTPRPASLGQLIQEYERETTPYYPFTASERGQHQYDRVLANDIGDDYRR